MPVPLQGMTACTPMAGNPLKTRADVVQALRNLTAPVERFRSAGGGLVAVDQAAATFDPVVAHMEGYARLLWGLAPAQAGGADWINWEPISQGLATGTNPAHADYWGEAGDGDQRLVELAAVGFALRLVPEALWDPLDAAEKRRVAAYLLTAHSRAYIDNNWKFFRLILGMGLRRIGLRPDQDSEEAYRRDLDSFYMGSGWYRDGAVRRADHYIAMAFHFYGLLLAALNEGENWATPYRERAALFAAHYRRWFADDGAAIAFGRSLTYRFAPAGFFGALAVAGTEPLSAGELRGYYLRHLRWWSQQPCMTRDGILSIGYAYPNLLMSEDYSSGQSPYWAMKAFLPLILPEEHPFWSAPERPAPPCDGVAVQKEPGFLISNPPGDAIALSSGQQNLWARAGAEKYAKFAYSARCGFCVETDPVNFNAAVLDNMIGFCDDGRHYRVRTRNEDVRFVGERLFARWRPYDDVLVETWLYWAGLLHVRIHCIRSPRSLQTLEGGFAVARETNGSPGLIQANGGGASLETSDAMTAVRDLGSTVSRSGRVFRCPPYASLMHSHAAVVQLQGDIAAGETVLAAAFIAHPVPSAVHAALNALPELPDISLLKRLSKTAGEPAPIMNAAATV